MTDIQGFEGLYAVTKDGKVWIHPKTWRVRSNYIQTRKGKWLIPERMKKGYLRAHLTKNKIIKKILVHRLVAQTYLPNPNSYLFVNHKNGIKSDNKVQNLEWCTSSMNSVHALETGLYIPIRGEKHGMSVFKETQIRQIRELYKGGEYSQRKLAKLFKTSQSQVNDILNKKIWKHVE